MSTPCNAGEHGKQKANFHSRRLFLQEELSLEMLQSIVTQESSVAVVLVDSHTLHQIERYNPRMFVYAHSSSAGRQVVWARSLLLTLIFCIFTDRIFSTDYSGHYIVVMDYDHKTDEFTCLNPSRCPGMLILLSFVYYFFMYSDVFICFRLWESELKNHTNRRSL